MSLTVKSLLAGVAYGLYFGLGFAFFEAIHFPAGQASGLYIPVFLMLALQGIGVARFFLTRKGTAFWIPAAGALSATTVLILIYAGLASLDGFSFELVKKFIGHFLLLSFLPLVVILLVSQPAVEIPDSKPEPAVNDAEPPESSAAAEVKMLRLDTGGEDELLEIPVSDLIFVEAADNYCKFYFYWSGKRTIKTLRMTLKEVEEALADSRFFFRIHRSFLVNAKQVEAIKGQSQAWKVKMTDFDDFLPVSRAFEVTELKNWMKKSTDLGSQS